MYVTQACYACILPCCGQIRAQWVTRTLHPFSAISHSVWHGGLPNGVRACHVYPGGKRSPGGDRGHNALCLWPVHSPAKRFRCQIKEWLAGTMVSGDILKDLGQKTVTWSLQCHWFKWQANTFYLLVIFYVQNYQLYCIHVYTHRELYWRKV